ncbi:hypothetical protein LXL04_031369 [Taraxacum kok-saghyz]
MRISDAAGNLVDEIAKLCQVIKTIKYEGTKEISLYPFVFYKNPRSIQQTVDCVAARERFLYEVESKEMNGAAHGGDSGMKIDLVTLIPNCWESCVWRADLITSFGVWCIHRVLELSLMESRLELWGKYTYVLNRLQWGTRAMRRRQFYSANGFVSGNRAIRNLFSKRRYLHNVALTTYFRLMNNNLFRKSDSGVKHASCWSKNFVALVLPYDQILAFLGKKLFVDGNGAEHVENMHNKMLNKKLAD